MMRYKNLHDIDTFACNDGEVWLSEKMKKVNHLQL